MNKTDFDNCGFTHSHYKACIQYALDSGYRFLRMKDALNKLDDDKIILMRHDYNLLSHESYSIAHKIIEMGHEIGFHYELHTHPALLEKEMELFERSKSLMESLLGAEIIGMSYHEPARFMNEKDKRELPPGIQYEAYEERFMDNYRYISDSSALWREGCMCQHIGKEDRLYILTHGFWWFDKSPVENY